MDQEKSAAGPELTEETERTPDQVREDIERTRAELGDTVAALAEKSDVKHQAKQAVDEAKETVAGKVSGVRQSVTGRKDEFVAAAQDATPESAGDAGQRVRAFAAENPLPLVAVGAFALGWMIRSRKG